MCENPLEQIKQDFLQTQQSFRQLVNLLDQWEKNPQADLSMQVSKQIASFANLAQRAAIKAAILLGMNQIQALIIRDNQ